MASGLGTVVRWGQYNSFESVGAVTIVGAVSEWEKHSVVSTQPSRGREGYQWTKHHDGFESTFDFLC